MSQFRRKYLLRLFNGVIAHSEFARTKQSETMILLLAKDGLAECVDLDGNASEPAGPDAYWQITDAGLKVIGRNETR